MLHVRSRDLRVSASIYCRPVVDYQPARTVSLKGHPSLSEKWLQERIVADTGLLGLGDLVVKDVERRQPRAGRLDLLLSDPDTATRYEVELQLGPTDETHIIRTIEYWDLERRRYPQYDHVAVIVAEDITSRFLNVISLFNGFIPLVAIQLRALQIGDVLTLSSTKVLDQLTLGAADDEDEAEQTTDRAYWEQKAAKGSLVLADRLLGIIRTAEPRVALKYNKNYIGLMRDGVADNFVQMRPRQQHVIAEFKIPRSDELTSRLEEQGVDALGYSTRWGRYRIRLTAADLDARQDLLLELVRTAHGTD
jgi:predicted transport protein